MNKEEFSVTAEKLIKNNRIDKAIQVIKEFLVENGVAEHRVDAKGMSNFQMRYPSPKDSFQAKENRRVEIVILAVE